MPKPIFQIGENGTLTVGARYTDEEKDRRLSKGTVNSAGMVAAGIPLEQNEQEITPRVLLTRINSPIT